MTTYWIMYIVPTLLALSLVKVSDDVNRLAWLGYLLLLILIIGLRFQVGGDWDPYWDNFVQARDLSLSDAIISYRDPAYWFFNWLFSKTGFEIWLLNLFCATVSVSGVVMIARRQPQPWVAIAVAVPYILTVVSMGYVRQAVALGLVCWALVAVQDKRYWYFLFFAVLSAMFHKSAVVILPLFLLTVPRIQLHHLIILVGIFGLVFSILVLETLETNWTNYVEKKKESDGALIRVVMNTSAALLLFIWRKKIGLSGENERHWYWFAWCSLIALFFVDYASTAVDRISLYLLPLQMVVFSRLYKIFDTPVVRSAVSVAVLLLYAVVMFVWLNYAKHADNWVPYQFFPFGI